MQAEVIQLIVDNKFDEAFTLLKQRTCLRDKVAYTQLIVLQSRYYKYKQNHITGTQNFDEMNLEFNRICAGLTDLVISNEVIFQNERVEDVKQWKRRFTVAIEEAGQQTMALSKSFYEKKDHKEKQYLVSWLVSNSTSIAQDVAIETFELLESNDKDRFEFEQCLRFALRFLFKSYLHDFKEWLDEPGFIFDFNNFTKTEVRLALVLMREKIIASEHILKQDKKGILERIVILDMGIKSLHLLNPENT